VDFLIGGTGDRGGRVIGKRSMRLHGESGTGTDAGRKRRSEDRQFQLCADGANRGRGNYGDLDQSRRYTSYGGLACLAIPVGRAAEGHCADAPCVWMPFEHADVDRIVANTFNVNGLLSIKCRLSG
jgi:hypothetical protein